MKFFVTPVLFCMTLFMTNSVCGQSTEATTTAPSSQSVKDLTSLSNTDVITMVQAGLDEETISAKIQHSSVNFDVSISGLIELKKANVPHNVVKTMLDRPQGPPSLVSRPDAAQAQPYSPKLKPLEEIERILIKAPTEVTRTTAEQVLREQKGPVSNPSETGYDAILIIGIDAGPQQQSLWTGANYCTCEGSITINISGNRIWSTTDHERSANSAKAAKVMIERMVEKFVTEWKSAKKTKIGSANVPILGQ